MASDLSFEELGVYTLPEPPYFLLVFGLLASITSGLAFEAGLKEKVQEWSRNRSTRTLAQMQGTQLQMPFLGMVLGVCLFLEAGLEFFGFPAWLAYAVSLLLTTATAFLVWGQLQRVLQQLERGGSRALDLDALE